MKQPYQGEEVIFSTWNLAFPGKGDILRK